MRRRNKEFDIIKLARYLIEPSNVSLVQFNETLEEEFSVVIKQLIQLIGEYELPSSSKKDIIKKSALTSFEPIISNLKEKLKNNENKKGEITIEVFEKELANLNIKLGSIEKSFCVYIMYENTKNVDRLQYETLIESLKSENFYKNDFEEDKNSITNKEFQSEKEELNDYNDDFDTEKEEEKPQVDKNFEQKDNPYNDNEYENYGENDMIINKMEPMDKEIEINEDQLMEIAQNYFKAIADYIKINEITLDSLFNSEIIQENIDGEPTNLITTKVFATKIREMKLEGLDDIKEACLIKILPTDETETYIRLNDLAQILEDYEGNEEIEYENLDYTMLDEASMIIIFALTDHLIKESISIYDLFNKYLSNELINDENGEQNEIEVVEALNFFNIIKEIGIDMEGNGHENLKEFLAVSPNNSEKLSFNKIKTAVGKFATDENLRKEAQRQYMKLANEIDNVESGH